MFVIYDTRNIKNRTVRDEKVTCGIGDFFTKVKRIENKQK